MTCHSLGFWSSGIRLVHCPLISPQGLSSRSLTANPCPQPCKDCSYLESSCFIATPSRGYIILLWKLFVHYRMTHVTTAIARVRSSTEAIYRRLRNIHTFENAYKALGIIYNYMPSTYQLQIASPCCVKFSLQEVPNFTWKVVKNATIHRSSKSLLFDVLGSQNEEDRAVQAAAVKLFHFLYVYISAKSTNHFCWEDLNCHLMSLLKLDNMVSCLFGSRAVPNLTSD